MTTRGNIWINHWSDGSTHLPQIEPPHPYPREQCRSNNIRTRGTNLLIRIISFDAESTSRNDAWHWQLLPNRPISVTDDCTCQHDKIVNHPYLRENGIKIEARCDRTLFVQRDKPCNNLHVGSLWTWEWEAIVGINRSTPILVSMTPTMHRLNRQF